MGLFSPLSLRRKTWLHRHGPYSSLLILVFLFFLFLVLCVFSPGVHWVPRNVALSHSGRPRRLRRWSNDGDDDDRAELSAQQQQRTDWKARLARTASNDRKVAVAAQPSFQHTTATTTTTILPPTAAREHFLLYIRRSSWFSSTLLLSLFNRKQLCLFRYSFFCWYLTFWVIDNRNANDERRYLDTTSVFVLDDNRKAFFFIVRVS